MTDHKSPSQLKRLLARLGAEIWGWGRGAHGDRTGTGITSCPVFMGGKQRVNPQAVCLRLKVTVSSLSSAVPDSGQADNTAFHGVRGQPALGGYHFYPGG